MDLIVCHDQADFDGLAAQVAAAKLYPGATLGLSPGVGRDVRSYLGLHRDRFGFVPAAQVDFDLVRRLVLVDVRRAARLVHVAPLLARRGSAQKPVVVHVYDHHAAHHDDVPGDLEVVERVGSVTTLLLERVRERNVPLDAVEATLFALAIHTDTGSLTYPGTTPRDAEALAFLLSVGASLDVLNRYLHTPFRVSQRRVMAELLQRTESLSLGGFRVAMCVSEMSAGKAVGLDEVTTRAFETLGCHALFAIYRIGARKTQIVARARAGFVDVGALLGHFGGGGHATAGAAALRDVAAPALREAILTELARLAPRARCARDVMRSPPHVVTPDTTLSELERDLVVWNETGACVTSDGQLVAVISRRDLAHAGRRSRPKVKDCMSRRLVTVDAAASLEAVLATMECEDVGRLPVLRDGRLVGIVTRANALEAMYGSPANLARDLRAGAKAS